MAIKKIGGITKSRANNTIPCNEILGIGGSPRRNGNSDVLLNQIITAANEENTKCRSVQLRDMQFQGCLGCEKCRKDMGFTIEAMKLPLEALGYTVIGERAVFKIFDKGEVKEDKQYWKKHLI